MADDWIKVRMDLVDDPNVFILSDKLSMECPTVVGHLVTFWGWISKHTVSGVGIKLSDDSIDKKMGIKGFSAAMRSIGWLDGSDMSIEIPLFDRHNSNSAKARSLESEAKRLRRAEQERLREEAQELVANTDSSPPPDKKPYKKSDGVGQPPDKKGTKCPTREEKEKSIITLSRGDFVGPPPNAPAILDGGDGLPKFKMHGLWVPSTNLRDHCTQAMIEFDQIPKERLVYLIADMRVYWMGRSEVRTQNRWELTLVQSMLKFKSQNQLYSPPPSGGSNAASGNASKKYVVDHTDTSWLTKHTQGSGDGGAGQPDFSGDAVGLHSLEKSH